MRKLRYENESPSIGIIIAIYVMCAIGVPFCPQENRKIMIYAMVGFATLMTIIYIPLFCSCMKHRRKYKKIKENGVKIPGRIMHIKDERHRSGDTTTYHYFVTVEYMDIHTGKYARTTSPRLNFNPHVCLASMNCNVYEHEDGIYISDFDPVQKGEKNVSEQMFSDEMNEMMKNQMKNYIIGSIIFVIVVIVLILICAGVIPFPA